MVASGIGLRPDEADVLESYRRIRDEGHGFVFVEFTQHRVTKYELKFGGQAPRLNNLLDALKPPKPDA